MAAGQGGQRRLGPQSGFAPFRIIEKTGLPGGAVAAALVESTFSYRHRQQRACEWGDTKLLILQ